MIKIAKSELKLVKVSSDALVKYCQYFGHNSVNSEGLYIRKLTAYILACNEINWFKPVVQEKDLYNNTNNRCYGIGNLRIFYNPDENFIYNIYKSDITLKLNATLYKSYQNYCNELGLSKQGNTWLFSFKPVNINKNVLVGFRNIFPNQKDISDDILTLKISSHIFACDEMKWYKDLEDENRLYLIEYLRVFYNKKLNLVYRIYESDKRIESNHVIKKLYYLICAYFGLDKHNNSWPKKNINEGKGDK